MAFKMKGFPLRSGFKHTGGTHEDHHGSGQVIQEKNLNVEENKNVVDNNTSDKVFMDSTKDFDKNYDKIKFEKAMAYYNRMLDLYNRQQNNPKIPDDEKMDEPIMPTMENIDDYDGMGRYRY